MCIAFTRRSFLVLYFAPCSGAQPYPYTVSSLKVI